MIYDCIIPKYLKPINYEGLIRLGRKNDGGYVVAKQDVLKSKTLISLGINDDWSFEESFFSLNNKIKIYCFDGSVNLRFFYKIMFKNALFLRFSLLVNSIKLIGSFIRFFRKKNINFINKHIGEFVTNNHHNLNISNYGKDIFLKIDIEGSEYRLLEKISDHQDRIRGLVIEFHDFDLNLKKIASFIKNLKLRPVNINVNNYGEINKKGIPTVIEVSFSRVKLNSKRQISPSWVNLNQKNCPSGYNVNLLFRKVS